MVVKRTFGAHWLAFAGSLQKSDGEQLAQAAAAATGANCKLFELACSPINQMSPQETARALRGGGITQAAYCRFFPNGEDGAQPPFGDPLGDEMGVTDALVTMRTDLDFIKGLRGEGIAVNFITGPGCFVLGKDYELSNAELRKRIYAYYKKVGKMIQGMDLMVAVEYLRPGEDQEVIGSMHELCRLIDNIGNPQIGIHGDIYHMLQRGEKPHEAIKMAGNRLVYLHAHGTDRLSPGAYEQDGVVSATDEVNWHLVGKALDAIDYKGPVVPEPFGEEIREEVPALGEGLPPAIDADRYYHLALSQFHRMGIVGA